MAAIIVHILGCLYMALDVLAEHCMSAVVNFSRKGLSSVQWGVQVKLCAFAFFSAAVDGGMWALATVPQGPPVPAGWEVGLAPEAVWTLWRREC